MTDARAALSFPEGDYPGSWARPSPAQKDKPPGYNDI